MGALLCVPCEVNLRETEWAQWTEKEKEMAGEGYPLIDTVRKEQKARAKEGWAALAEPIKAAKKALKALKENPVGGAIQVNFAQCMETLTEEDEKDVLSQLAILDMTPASSTVPTTALAITGAGDPGPTTPAIPGASDDGPDSKRLKATSTFPAGRANLPITEVRADTNLTAKQTKVYILRKSRDLSRGLMGMMKGSKETLGAFAKAGQTLMKQLGLYEKLEAAKKLYDETKAVEDFDELEKLEEKFEAAQEYETAVERGTEEQVKVLKALDYGDNLCHGWRRFYVCKAKNGAGQYCGFAYPSKLWFQKGRKTGKTSAERLDPGNWKFMCMCMWEYLEEEALDRPGSPAAEWFAEMQKEYGEKVTDFPHIGCGANYVPWKRGPSMVCEILMKQEGDVWEAFLADHTPVALDDQLKKLKYEALSLAFGQLAPEMIYKAIPMTMPMTHLHTVNGKKMSGVAKYPLDAWIAAGDPCFTSEKWAMLCLMIAEKGMDASNEKMFSPQDRDVFERLFAVASQMKATGIGAQP